MSLRAAPGRRLVVGPRWQCSEGRVVFDATSGDFWVLAEDAVRVVESVLSGGGIELEQDPALILSLVDNGIIVAPSASPALKPS